MLPQELLPQELLHLQDPVHVRRQGLGTSLGAQLAGGSGRLPQSFECQCVEPLESLTRVGLAGCGALHVRERLTGWG